MSAEMSLLLWLTTSKPSRSRLSGSIGLIDQSNHITVFLHVRETHYMDLYFFFKIKFFFAFSYYLYTYVRETHQLGFYIFLNYIFLIIFLYFPIISAGM